MSHNPPIVFESIEAASEWIAGRPVALTVGTFDGVHRAHRELFATAIERAKTFHGLAGALTFQNHPRSVVGPEHCPPLLTPWPRKAVLMQNSHLHFVVGVQFTPEFSQTEAEDFIARVLVGSLNAKAVICGPDFRFGRNGAGGPEMLARMGADLGFVFEKRQPILWHGEKIASTRVRAALEVGAVAIAAKLLGRPHVNDGPVVSGDRLGRTIGFPTANLNIGSDQMLPADGVYAVRVHLPDDAVCGGMMNLGMRPTVSGREHRREVHLFDFSGELEGQVLEVEYIERLRDEKRFAGLAELKAQLSLDEISARAVLAAHFV